MIKILEHGNAWRVVTCDCCEAVIEYTILDYQKQLAESNCKPSCKCPDCGYTVILKG